MKNTAFLFFFSGLLAISSAALQFDVGVSQWNRIALSENTLLACPGGELFGAFPVSPHVYLRLSAYGGLWFGTAIGGEASAMYEWRRNSWIPMAGGGVYAGYEDVLFHTTDSYSYIPPDSFGAGLMLHLKPFRWKSRQNQVSLAGISIGTDFRHLFNIINYDIRIIEISHTFGGAE